MADYTKPETTKNESGDEIDIVSPEEESSKAPEADPAAELKQYVAILESLKTAKKHITVVPTNTPKNFSEQLQFYDDGVDVRLYIWINGTWRYVALT